MTIQPIITEAASDQQRKKAEDTDLPFFVTGFDEGLAASEAFAGQDDIDPDALASGIAEIRARAEAGFDAAIYLELQGTRGHSGLAVWEEVLLAALAARIGLDEDVDLTDINTASRLGLV